MKYFKKCDKPKIFDDRWKWKQKWYYDSNSNGGNELRMFVPFIKQFFVAFILTLHQLSFQTAGGILYSITINYHSINYESQSDIKRKMEKN